MILTHRVTARDTLYISDSLTLSEAITKQNEQQLLLQVPRIISSSLSEAAIRMGNSNSLHLFVVTNHPGFGYKSPLRSSFHQIGANDYPAMNLFG
jgi:hypothetical protein